MRSGAAEIREEQRNLQRLMSEMKGIRWRKIEADVAIGNHSKGTMKNPKLSLLLTLKRIIQHARRDEIFKYFLITGESQLVENHSLAPLSGFQQL